MLQLSTMSKLFKVHAIIGIENRSLHLIFKRCPNQMRTFKQNKVAINLVFEAN